MARRNQKEREPRLSKAQTGIDGVDEITGGGLPRGRTTLLAGPAGSGKTVLALQTLVNGARRFDEPGIFVAFEEGFQQVVANAASFGWEIPSLVQKRGRRSPRLAFVDGRLSPGAVQAGTFDLSGLLAAVEFRAKEIGAKRIVFDGIDVLLVMLNDPRVERGEMCRIHDLLERAGVAGGVSMSTAGLEPPRRFLLSLSDCIIQLTHRLAERASIRGFRVVKYRGSAFIANEFPFAIASQGIEVADFGTRPKYRVFTERVSSGIPRLDHMLAGGYFRGSTVLVTGMPGTAKTTLAGAFVAAACARGERALYISLDEQPAEILRNLASVSIRLERYVRSRLLEIYADHPQETSPEEQFVRMRQRIRAHRPSTHELLLRARLLGMIRRSEEHTSELQSQSNLVCRLLLEKKKRTSRDIGEIWRLRARTTTCGHCHSDIRAAYTRQDCSDSDENARAHSHKSTGSVISGRRR